MKYWIKPANINIFDLDSAYSENATVDWVQNNNFEIGDIIYLYSSDPIRKITHKCVVRNIDLRRNDTIDNSRYWRDIAKRDEALRKDRFVRLELVRVLDNPKTPSDIGIFHNIQSPSVLSQDQVNIIEENVTISAGSMYEWVCKKIKKLYETCKDEYDKQINGIEETIRKWNVYREKIINGTLSIDDYTNYIDNSDYLLYFLEFGSNFGGITGHGSLGMMVKREKDGSYKLYDESIVNRQEAEVYYNEKILPLLQLLLGQNSLSELCEFERNNQLYQEYRLKDFLRKIVVLESCVKNADYKNKLLFMHKDEWISNLSIVLGVKEENDNSFFSNSYKCFCKILEILGINEDQADLKMAQTVYEIALVIAKDYTKKTNGVRPQKCDTGLKKEDWLNILRDPALVRSEDIDILKRWYNSQDRSATCKTIGNQLYPGNPNGYKTVTGIITNLCKKICMSKDRIIIDNQSFTYIFLMMNGKKTRSDEEGSYIWILKDEVAEALEELGIEGNNSTATDNSEDGGNNMSKLKVDLNTILYGPPGTGKTFISRAYAVAICDKVEDVKEYVEKDFNAYKDEIIPKFNNLLNDKRIVFTTFHQSYGYEDFIRGIKPKENSDTVSYETKDGIFKDLCDRARNDKDNNYVIVIDEINRGNISKIFGELITLIEKSKREKEIEALSCVLPNAKEGDEPFSVPNNVYILGTMNTADRSIALLDTALRRRFSFIEMMPRVDKLAGKIVEGIDIEQMVEAMNNRICILYDREHTIGHSFFMSLTNESKIGDLKEIFKYKIIPLLQEYFYEDYEKIQLVLGDNYQSNEDLKFIKEIQINNKLFGNYDINNLSNDKYYEINDSAFENENCYINIYSYEKGE